MILSLRVKTATLSCNSGQKHTKVDRKAANYSREKRDANDALPRARKEARMSVPHSPSFYNAAPRILPVSKHPRQKTPGSRDDCYSRDVNVSAVFPVPPLELKNPEYSASFCLDQRQESIPAFPGFLAHSDTTILREDYVVLWEA